MREQINTCERCKSEFLSPTGTARFCRICRRNVLSEHAKRRDLCHIGATARWGKGGSNCGD